MAAAFNHSIARSTAFVRWQEIAGYKPAQLFITVSKTRWHGYLDSMKRYKVLVDRLRKWLREELDDNLNLEPI